MNLKYFNKYSDFIFNHKISIKTMCYVRYGSIDVDLNTLESEETSEFDGLLYRDPAAATSTLHMLNVLRKNRQLCDLILQLDDDSQDIYCHQVF